MGWCTLPGVLESGRGVWLSGRGGDLRAVVDTDMVVVEGGSVHPGGPNEWCRVLGGRGVARGTVTRGLI